jgi:hypothetical protein
MTLGEKIDARIYASTLMTVPCTKTLIAAPYTATTIRVFFDNGAVEIRAPGVAVENTSPNIKARTIDLAGSKLATYTIDGVVYREASREKLNPEETQLQLTTITF